MDGCSEDFLRDLISLIAEKHPDKSLVFKYLELFKQNGYDLRDRIGAVIYAETMFAKHIYTVSPEVGSYLGDLYLFQSDVLTNKVLFFDIVSSTPGDIEKRFSETNEKLDSDYNLDWTIELWRVCDKITELSRVRRRYKTEIEETGKRVLYNLKKWEDFGVF